MENIVTEKYNPEHIQKTKSKPSKRIKLHIEDLKREGLLSSDLNCDEDYELICEKIEEIHKEECVLHEELIKKGHTCITVFCTSYPKFFAWCCRDPCVNSNK